MAAQRMYGVYDRRNSRCNWQIVVFRKTLDEAKGTRDAHAKKVATWAWGDDRASCQAWRKGQVGIASLPDAAYLGDLSSLASNDLRVMWVVAVAEQKGE